MGAWRLHDMKTLSALLALCDGNPLFTGGFPSQRASDFDFFLFLAWTHCWTNSWVASDLRYPCQCISAFPSQNASNFDFPPFLPWTGCGTNRWVASDIRCPCDCTVSHIQYCYLMRENICKIIKSKRNIEKNVVFNFVMSSVPADN